ncbi:flagellar protein FlaF, partial [Trichlorobacter thiogenes]
MYQNPANAYTTMQKETLSGRELEASVLTRAGLMLKQVQESWSAQDRDEKLLEAIKFNQKVWSFFQAELSDPENPLPIKLREDILNLSLFVDKRLFEV